jgi:lipid-binding SYLF domain-containing protein
MNARGAERLMSSQFTLGADGQVAAGPVGRHATAETDGKFTAEMLSWSRSRGVFAGVALKGATLRADETDNADLYGSKMDSKEVIHSSIAVPESAEPLIRLLSRYSPKEQ